MLFNAIEQGVVYLDATGRITAANPAAERILGLSVETIATRTSIDPRWHAMAADGSRLLPEQHPSMITLRTGERTGPIQMGIEHPELGIRWLQVTAIPLPRRPGRNRSGVCVIFDDISTRKIAEDALKVSEGRVRRLVDANVIGLIVAELEGVIQANDAFLDMVGYDRDDLVAGRIDWRAMTPDEFLPQVETAIRDIATSGVSATFEKAYVRKDGTLVPVLIGGTQLNADPLRWISFVVDLTTQKLAQREIKRQADLLDQAYDAIFAWELDGGITYWNRGAELLYGYRADEAMGRTTQQLLQTQYPGSRDLFLQSLLRDGYYEDELAQIHRDGRAIAVETRHVVVHDEDRTYVLEVNRDVTSRKEFEEERRAFIDTLAHDLKNPLGAISVQMQLLRRRLARPEPPTPETIDRGAESALRSVEQMTGLIGQMLDTAYLRDGQSLELKREPVDLVALASAARDASARQSPGHTIRLVASDPALVGDWDRSRLERVLGNLLDNAIKYSPDGQEIVVEIERVGKWAVLRVRDHGLGIPADDQATIFERYRRARNVVGKFAGAGIGLAGVRQIVEQHGGAIAVESTEGEGSTFTVRLPLT
ncbi:MAG: PAS domain S-box protein [Thermomicrobiales bacterium]|nr:PAS domain S-box protein [Thermomicrobiales bacterium]